MGAIRRFANAVRNRIRGRRAASATSARSSST